MTTSTPSTYSFSVDKLRVWVAPNRQALGQQAGLAVADKIRALLQQQDFVNVIFASAPSQNEFLDTLAPEADIDWLRVRAFHMDEYIGLSANAPQTFGRYLKEKLFDKVSIRDVFYLDGNAPTPQQECRRYAALLEQYPTDITCMGIGENCHIAFNDPHVADFDDPVLVKTVDLDLTSRNQQVYDKCFDALEQVPTHALTLTIPALLRARHIFCMVPGTQKAEAINHTLADVVSETFPSTRLRNHADSRLFIDTDSGRKFLDESI